MPKMTTDEARAWLTTLAKETGASFEKSDVADLTRRNPEDIEAVKAAYEQQYALRGATGGVRSEGGYSTELVDDPERQWTRGVAAQAYDPGRKATEGEEGIPYAPPGGDEKPENIASQDVRTRIIQMYDWFHGRVPDEDEITGWHKALQFHWGGEPDKWKVRGNWEQLLHEGIVGSTEYEETSEKRLEDLYLKYYGRMPDRGSFEYNNNLRHPQGLAGVEWELAQGPTQAYKDANPVKEAVAGVTGIAATPAVAATTASWNRGIPTMGDILNPRPVPDPLSDPDPVTTVDTDPPSTRLTAQPTIAPPKAPYSARPVTQPYTVNPMTGSSSASWTPPPYTAQQVYPPGMPSVSPYQGTLGSTVSASTLPTVASGGDPASWDNFDGYYGRAGQDYAAGSQGWGYNPAPWANTDRLLRGQFGRPGLAGTNTSPFTGDGTDRSDESAADRRARRAYEFGRQESVGNQRNADLGNQDFRSQMERWIRSYNRWNQQGVDPFAPPVGGRRAITGTGSSNNTGGL
jgi:hypothetical protein